VGGEPSRPQPKAPGDVFRQAGYSAGLTRFGRSPEGRSAAFLLPQGHAQTTSYGYGYKWELFLAYWGTSRCPLPASVETIGYYLGYLFRQGRVTGTSVRPYLAAIRAMHTRAGFPSPTEDPVISALRAGYTRATADRVASRPSSVALPAALGHLALTRAIRSRRPNIGAAIAVGLLFALRPMSISGLQSDDISLKASNAFIRLRREKGNRGHRRDRVLRFPLSTTPDAVSKLLTSLSQYEAGTPLFLFSAALLNRHLIRLSRKVGQPPPPLGRFTCRSLRSGCISAAHTTGILLARIMALSGHASLQVLIRHYLDASIAPYPTARKMFGRLSSS
jgi:integrase